MSLFGGAEFAAVFALGDGTAFLLELEERSIDMLARRCAMSLNARLTVIEEAHDMSARRVARYERSTMHISFR